MVRTEDEDGRRGRGQGGPRSAQGGSMSVKALVRVAQRVLRTSEWSSYEITTAEGASIRVHRDVMLSASPTGQARRAAAPPPAPVPIDEPSGRHMNRKARKALRAQARGKLRKMALTGVLRDAHPMRRWAIFRDFVTSQRVDDAAAAPGAAPVAMSMGTAAVEPPAPAQDESKGADRVATQSPDPHELVSLADMEVTLDQLVGAPGSGGGGAAKRKHSSPGKGKKGGRSRGRGGR